MSRFFMINSELEAARAAYRLIEGGHAVTRYSRGGGQVALRVEAVGTSDVDALLAVAAPSARPVSGQAAGIDERWSFERDRNGPVAVGL